MYDNTQLRELLEDNIYILKQHIALCNDKEKALPIKVYQRNLLALNEFNLTKEQVSNNKILTNLNTELQETNTTNETSITGASALLLSSGLLVENQVRCTRNNNFIKKCNEFINTYGVSTFNNVLERVKQYQDKGIKIKNIYGYISKALQSQEREEQNKV